MAQRFKKTGHPIFTNASAPSRGILRMLKGKETISFNADTLNTKLLFRIVHSANQLSINGAVSKWSEEFGLKPEERGPKFADKENSVNGEMLKSVASQEMKSLLFAPWTKASSRNGLRENLQNFESLTKTFQFTRFCELASLWYRVDVGMKYNTVLGVNDLFGDSIPACRENILPRLDLNSNMFVAVPGGTVIGPVLEVHIVLLHGKHGLEIKIPSPNDPNRTSWVLMSRGKNRFVNEFHIPIQDTISPVPNCLRNGKKSNLVHWNRSQAVLGKLVRDNSGLFLIRCALRKKSYLWKKGIGKVFLPMNSTSTDLFLPRSRKWSCDYCVIMIKMSEISTEQFIGILWVPYYWEHSDIKEHENFPKKDWLKHVHERSDETRFEYCESSRNSLVFVRAIQGHTGVQMMAPGLMGHVAIPYGWKEFVFHRGWSFNLSSILEIGLIAWWIESTEGRHTFFFTPLNPFWAKFRLRMIAQDRESLSVNGNMFRTPSTG